MTPPSRFIRSRLSSLATLTAFAVLASGLGGCITLLPKATSAQLYRFGAAEPTPAALGRPLAVEAPRVAVLLDGVTLPRAASGDGLLTVTGDQAAYIAGARWITPAVLMFNEATQRAFDARAAQTRLTSRGALGRVKASLRLSVRDFQAEYPGGAGAAPTVVVTLHARLSRSDGTTLADAEFAARKPAADDRVSAIVPAYDAAVEEVLGRVVAWTDANAPAAETAPFVEPPPPRVGRSGTTGG